MYLASLVWAPVLSELPMSVAVCDSLSLCLDVAVCLVNIAPGIAMAPNIALCLISFV